MDNGKRICNFLKNIRKRIASENGIAYNPHECQFTGACKGTCPACENEIKYLERQIDARKKSGLPTKVTGNSHLDVRHFSSISSGTKHHRHKR